MYIIYRESKDLDTLYLELGTKSRIQLQRHWSEPATSMHLVALDPWGSELLQEFGQTGGWGMEGVGKDQLSNEKRAPGCLGFVGDDILPMLYRDYFINHDVRIPTNQPVFHGFFFIEEFLSSKSIRQMDVTMIHGVYTSWRDIKVNIPWAPNTHGKIRFGPPKNQVIYH